MADSDLSIGDIYTIKEPEKYEKIRKEARRELAMLFHYHGDTVRELFVLGSLIMAITLPFLHDSLPVPLFVSIIFIIAMAAIAGFTNPTKFATIVIDAIVSLAAVSVFEYYAVEADGYGTLFHLVNQSLAVIFLIAAYYSIKTIRGVWLDSNRSFREEIWGRTLLS